MENLCGPAPALLPNLNVDESAIFFEFISKVGMSLFSCRDRTVGLILTRILAEPYPKGHRRPRLEISSCTCGVCLVAVSYALDSFVVFILIRPLTGPCKASKRSWIRTLKPRKYQSCSRHNPKTQNTHCREVYCVRVCNISEGVPGTKCKAQFTWNNFHLHKHHCISMQVQKGSIVFSCSRYGLTCHWDQACQSIKGHIVFAPCWRKCESQ